MQLNTGILHDNNLVVPTVGMTGLFNLKLPYANLIDPNIEYTCISVINLSGMIALGQTPKDDVYIIAGDTEDNYLLDLANNNCIITLQSGKGNIVSVPNSSLIKLPSADGVNYYSAVIGTSISIVPEYSNLELLQTEINDLVFKHLGVQSESFVSLISGSILIPHDKHTLLESTRLANIASSTNTILENESLKQSNRLLVAKVVMLENYIKTKLI
jgi:hypothetical protein